MKRTAEKITPRHPDKICDRISDAILDECLRQDPNSRVALETMGGHNIVTVTGELTTNAFVNIKPIAERIVGYPIGVQENIVQQSPEIARGVDIGGAGDQGIMIGYACRDNEKMLPQEYYLANDLCQFIYAKFPEDGKVQITLDEEEKIIDCILASFCKATSSELKSLIEEWAKNKTSQYEIKQILCNPAGDWNICGLFADTGVTGRKIVCDAYGPRIPVGGGAYSGKDGTKVDRSAAYIARRIAMDILKHNENYYDVLVRIAYAIGVVDPIMATYEAHTLTGEVIKENLDSSNHVLSPAKIIELLKLKEPIYEKTADWGAYGNGFMWDKE